MSNLGATVSYNLALTAFGKSIPYQIMHNDGVNASVDADARNVTTDNFLMMPSSRAEIYLDRGEICKAIGSKCNGTDVDVSMSIVEWNCPDGKSNTCGDLWPTGKIMDIVLPSLSPNELSRPLKSTVKPSDAVATIAEEAVQTAGTQLQCADGTAVAKRLDAGEFRVIALWNGEMHEEEMFAMSTDAKAHRTIPDFSTPENMNPAWLHKMGFKPFNHHHTDLCISAEQNESWLIYNASDEFHNFHVHQTDFNVTEVSASDPTKPGLPIGVVVDNYPVPPHHWIKISLRFSNSQAGRFVYHCHILEHEDKGMMSTIEVVPGNIVTAN
jgi:FtsP/CotA-like multicopper oxidase with cupredoxin domain